MELEAEREGGTLIARGYGRIDGANARDFENALNSALGPNDKALVLDMQSFALF